jgi:S1-C subfamily serine protease
MDDPDWKFPEHLQPAQDRYDFDLDNKLGAVVMVNASIPSDAFTARILGDDRSGNGILISSDGLILTIGYLITEADNVWLTTVGGDAVRGHVVAVDQATGFGLIQALGRIDAQPIELGDSRAVAPGTAGIFAGAGGRRHAVQVEVADLRPFAGYWEYMIDRAFFTSPVHPLWGGGALIGADGKLLGVGSLVVQRKTAAGETANLNMVVPIEFLIPILDDLKMLGRSKVPPRPWLGLYCDEADGAVFVQSVAPAGPADKAGILAEDRIVAVDNVEVDDLIALWRAIWVLGPAGTAIPLTLIRSGSTLNLTVASADRGSFLKGPRLH